jgi:ABC-2 type transport system permease protein
MNRTVFSLTLRQFFGQKRSLLLFLLALVPLGVALIYRAGDQVDQQDWTANVLLNGIVITTVLPLACLIFGTSALGSEIEDGTAVYILARPVPRGEIIVAKFAAAALAVAVFIVPATGLAGLIALQGASEQGIATGFALATFLGVAAYTGVFILLSVASSRALIIGLAYVFIWEGIVTELFAGTRWVSIRQYCLGVADLVSSVRKEDFNAELNGLAALILTGCVTLVALALATQRLRRFELTETD